MLNLNLYVHGAGRIVPEGNAEHDTLKRLANEPDYTAWIPPMQLRRTSKVVRMGIGAASLCLEASAIKKPDALSVGTAMGCLQDTEVFLSKMVNQDEKMLTPTAFIQSTHNTVGGQIALLSGCHGHNMTYVHRGHSFEHALINTRLYLQDHPGKTVLTGGIDELTNSSHILMQRLGFYRTETAKNEPPAGVTAGEGAVFFAINNQEDGSIMHIQSLYLFNTTSTEKAIEEVAHFIAQNGIAHPDLLILGRNQEKEQNEGFYDGVQMLIPDAPVAFFKDGCGEYATAISYALSMLVHDYCGDRQQKKNKIALIINHFCDYYSCWIINY